MTSNIRVVLFLLCMVCAESTVFAMQTKIAKNACVLTAVVSSWTSNSYAEMCCSYVRTSKYWSEQDRFGQRMGWRENCRENVGYCLKRAKVNGLKSSVGAFVALYALYQYKKLSEKE